MIGELLWEYEGLTQYLGEVLAARSGAWSADDYRENLALTAAMLDHRGGRSWRPLEDTAVAAQLLYFAPESWAGLRRGTDFYPEGTLVWLAVDTLIRQQSEGRRSLDDFCRQFHGGSSGRAEVRPYTFDDLTASLNQVAPYDWKGFFTALADAGYSGGLNIENEDQFYYPSYDGTDFTEAFKEGFRVAHAYVRQFVPPGTGK